MNFKIIACDFDGTLCENKWPEIGEPNLEVINYLKKQQAGGDVKLILWTCRIGNKLSDAVFWCKLHDLKFDAVNENLPEVIKEHGGDSRKIFAHEYIDDRSSNRFKLPYMSNGIDGKIINVLEKIFSITFHDWQKEYLRGGQMVNHGRRTGKTFVYCLRLLLENREPFVVNNFETMHSLVDELNGPAYIAWFARYLLDLNFELIMAGFKTNLKGSYTGKRANNNVIDDACPENIKKEI